MGLEKMQQVLQHDPRDTDDFPATRKEPPLHPYARPEVYAILNVFASPMRFGPTRNSSNACVSRSHKYITDGWLITHEGPDESGNRYPSHTQPLDGYNGVPDWVHCPFRVKHGSVANPNRAAESSRRLERRRELCGKETAAESHQPAHMAYAATKYSLRERIVS